MRELQDFFRTFTDYSEPSASPYFLAHVVQLGEVARSLILPREIDSGLYLSTPNWTRRGEVAVATTCIFLNSVYNRFSNHELSPALSFLFPRSLITVCSQFWREERFSKIRAGHCLDNFNSLFAVSNEHRDDRKLMATHLGLAAQRLDDSGNDAMIRYSGYLLGVTDELYPNLV